MIFFLPDLGWYFKNAMGFPEGPYKTKEEAITALIDYLKTL